MPQPGFLRQVRLGGAPVYVDKMDNEVWLMLGAGPNLAVLVKTDGTVLAKQSWLDIDALAPILRERPGAGSAIR